MVTPYFHLLLSFNAFSGSLASVVYVRSSPSAIIAGFTTNALLMVFRVEIIA